MFEVRKNTMLAAFVVVFYVACRRDVVQGSPTYSGCEAKITTQYLCRCQKLAKQSSTLGSTESILGAAVGEVEFGD